jgi:hypothetical protein
MVRLALVLCRDEDFDGKPEEAVPYGECGDPIVVTVVLDSCH